MRERASGQRQLHPLRAKNGCLLLAAGLLSAPADAAVLWNATFEKGDSSEWMPGTNAKGPDGVRQNFEVLAEQVYRGKFAGKITLHPDDLFGQYKQDRVDIQHQSTLTAEGQNLWISGHYLMPEDAKVRNELAFFESNVSSPTIGTTLPSDPSGCSVTPRKTNHESGAATLLTLLGLASAARRRQRR